MASLHDIRPVLKSCGLWAFLKRVYQQINEDGIFVWASALAYSWLFSVFPFLILLLSLVPYLPDSAKQSAYTAIKGFVTSMLGKSASTINDYIQKVIYTPRRGWLGIGLAVSLWVASGGMAMTMSALDRCYDIKNGRSYLHQRAVAMVLTIIVVSGVLMMIVLLPVGAAAGAWLSHTGMLNGPLRLVFDLVRYILSIVFAIFVLAIVYYFGPFIHQKFQLLSPGALFSAVVWIMTDLGFRYYVDKYARYDQTYGSVGGAAILLLFFYIDGLVLLIGAEINSEIDFERLGVPEGSQDFTGPPRGKTPLPTITPEL
jgi:membrane protein